MWQYLEERHMTGEGGRSTTARAPTDAPAPLSAERARDPTSSAATPRPPEGAGGEPGVMLFGRPAVLVDRRWVPLHPGKAGAIVAYLAHRSAPVRRAEVAALLWPDLDEERAFTNLRQLLRSLAVGPFGGVVQRERGLLRVGIRSDHDAFERAVDEGRWADAVDWYRGPFLDGFEAMDAGEFGSWLASERNVAEGRWRMACIALLDEATRDAKYVRALQLAERLLRADPLDEMALRHAMLAAAAGGDRHGAQLRYEAFCVALRDEVGMEPDSATVGLAEQLFANTVPLGPAREATQSTDSAAHPYGRRITDVVSLVDYAQGRRRLLGCDRALVELKELVQRSDVRILTLLAPGGMGKTALAMALAEEVGSAFPDGVLIARLDGVSGHEAVAHTLAAAAGVSPSHDASTQEQLTAALSPRRSLVVLDGFEDHLDQISLIDALARAAPHLTLVLTSRVRLRLSSETVFEVEPLATARRGAGAQEPSDAARLFLRAAAKVAGRPLGANSSAAVERICRAVDGNPLAIELVAAWLDVLPLDEVERQLTRSWDLLRSDAVDRADGRDDLHAAIGATWRQLEPEDQAAWARLAVLPGSLDRTVAAVVAGTGWRGLRRLADRAVLRHRGERLELHALLARFGRERAVEGGLVDGAWEAALAVFRERIALEVDPRSGHRVRVHDHDLDQALGAWRWALETQRWGDVGAMAVGLLRALDRAGWSRDLGSAAGAAEERLSAAKGRDRDHALARVLPHVPANPADATANAERALELAGRVADERAIGCACAALLRTDPARDADARAGRAYEAFERSGDLVGLGELLLERGEMLVSVGRLEPGETYLKRALELHERLGDRCGQARAHDALTIGPLLRGDVDAARVGVHTASALFEDEGAVYRGSGTLHTEFCIALLTGPREAAEACADAFIASEARFGDTALASATVRGALHARYGEHAEVVAQARWVLERLGPCDHPRSAALLAHQRLARSLAALGDVRQAAEHLASAISMARALAAPRFVASVTLSAGALALALERRSAARRLLELAWEHPSLEALLRDDLRSLFERLGASVPPIPTVRSADDEASLALAEALLKG